MAGALVLLAAVAVADAALPLGVAVWVLYLLPLGMTLFSFTPALPLAVAGGSTLFTLAGFFVSPTTFMPGWLPPTNRALGIVAFWGTAAVAYHFVTSKVALRRQAWLRQGQMELTRAIEGDRSVEEVAEAGLRQLAPWLGAPVGVVHVAEDGRFVRRAAFAVTSEAGPDHYALREGLGGQAALEKKALVLEPGTSERLRFASVLLAAAPAVVVAAPAIVDDEVIAVVELGLTRAIDGADRELFDMALPRLALALRSATDRARLEILLAETQRQAEELQAQSEELRVANEELEQQGEGAARRPGPARGAAGGARGYQRRAGGAVGGSGGARRRPPRGARGAAGAGHRAGEGEPVQVGVPRQHVARAPHAAQQHPHPLEAAGGEPERRLGADEVRYASTIHGASEDLLALINDILDLAKVEAGRVELSLEETSVAWVVEELARTFDPVASERGLAFEKALGPRLPEKLTTDRQRLLQILRNLLSNAFKFTDRGGVALLVEIAAPGRVAFAVRDTGIGIAPENQGAVFEAFHQLEAGPSRRRGGTGLGLSITRELVGRLGGELTLESAPGRGSTFTVTLPVAGPESAVAAQPRERRRSANELPPGAERRGERPRSANLGPGPRGPALLVPSLCLERAVRWE